jgi:AraC-like DNA-binding protein
MARAISMKKKSPPRNTAAELSRSMERIGRRTREYLVHPVQCPPFLQHGIRLAGLSYAGADFRFRRPNPPFLQILVCLKGEGRVWVDGGWRTCLAGDAYITPPHVPHAYEALKWEVGWVHYDAETWDSLKFTTPELRRMDPRLFSPILQGLYEESGHRGDLAMLEHWTELLHEEVRRVLQGEQSARLWQLWQAVQADLAAAWTLPKLALQAGMGGERLRILCRAELDRSPMEHVTYLRMHHAVALLSAGHKAQAVAEAVGYDNAFAFSSAFKRVMGQSPRAYKIPGSRGL